MPKRPNMKKQLRERTKQSYKTKDSGNRTNILKVPDNIEFLEIKDKKRYKIDILPFEIVTDNYPDPEIKKGDWHYKLDLWVHRFIGPGEGNYVCLAKNYNKPCYLCEEHETAKNDEKIKDEIAEALKPKRRVAYVILDSDDEKVKLFESSHYLFEKELLDEAWQAKDGEIITFSDLDDGYSIKFRASEETISIKKSDGSFATQKFIKFKGFSFVEREEPIDDEILEQTISLDKILIIHTYEEMKEALHGIETDDDEDEKPRKAKKFYFKKQKSSKDEEEPTDEEYYDEVIDKSDKKKSSKKKTNKKKVIECPHDYTFGIDCEEYDECEECEKWEECSEYVG